MCVLFILFLVCLLASDVLRDVLAVGTDEGEFTRTLLLETESLDVLFPVLQVWSSWWIAMTVSGSTKLGRNWWGCWPRTSCEMRFFLSLPTNRYKDAVLGCFCALASFYRCFLCLCFFCLHFFLGCRTSPMPWTLRRSQTSWVYTPYVIATGTFRPPAPPAAMVSTKAWIGWPISWKTKSEAPEQ